MRRLRTTKRSTDSTNWKRRAESDDRKVDLSDCDEIPPEMFAKAIVRRGLEVLPRKTQLTVRLDRDVLDWFRAQGRGYHTRINALLRAYMNAHHKTRTRRKSKRAP